MKTKTFDFAYNSLNQAQKEAVDYVEGQLMVIAGPGTGKTQLLAVRVANILLKTQALPSNILCLTFTDSAAKEMRNRLLSIIGNDAYSINIHTFHSFCNDIISRYPEKFELIKEEMPLNEFELIDIYRSIIEECSLKETKPLNNIYFLLNEFRHAVSDLKKEYITCEKLKKALTTEENRLKAIPEKELINPKTGRKKIKYLEEERQLRKNWDLYLVYEKYLEKQRKIGRVDFDDMINFVIKKSQEDSDFLAYFKEQFQYVLVDEYQDTNGSQNELIKLIFPGNEKPNLMVVLDDDQSIYRFQGASMENIFYFGKNYPEHKSIVLTENYRSTQTILDAAKSVIENNSQRLSSLLKIEKNLKAKNNNNEEKIKICSFINQDDEMNNLVEGIKMLIEKKKVDLSEIAIIYRRNNEAERIISALNKANIPYSVSKDESLLNNTFIRGFIDLLRIISDPKIFEFEEIFFRTLHLEYLGIDSYDIFRICRLAYYKRKSLSLYFMDDLPKEINLLSKEKIEKFKINFLNWQKDKYNLPLPFLIEKILIDGGLMDFLLADSKRHADFLRLKALFKLIQELNRSSKICYLSDFIYYVDLCESHNLSLNYEIRNYRNEGAVRLMTAHKSKGMEFMAVFIVGCVDGIWGNTRDKRHFKIIDNFLSKEILSAKGKNEDERRLFYVALTRAKQYLFVSYAENYLLNGTNRTYIPSQFINEISATTFDLKEGISLKNNIDQKLEDIAFFDVLISTEAKEYLKNLANEFVLSPTSLNKFLLCPRKFMYDVLLRVPKTKSATLSLGTAVHTALEKLYKNFKFKDEIISLNEFLGIFNKKLLKEGLSKADYEQAKLKGGKMLTEFYMDNQYKFIKPLETEFDFRKHHVRFENIPITGKIDKIEALNQSPDEVVIIDYKTGAYRSQNYLLGKTQENDLNYLRQGFFYLLLTECDPFFKYKTKKIVFDFIEDKKRQEIPIERSDYNKFKIELQKADEKIKKLEFDKTEDKKVCKNCGPKGGLCEFYNICWPNSKI